MCTVTFIPGNGKYYFTSLRNENPERQKAMIPAQVNAAGKCNFIAPVDPLGGGIWAGVNELGNVIILLHGGFKNHTKKNDYIKSRGSIVTLLKVAAPISDWHLISLNYIEPFTLIVWADDKLFQLVWDGEQKYRIDLCKKETHIWSSSTLYEDRAKKIWLKLFTHWIDTKSTVSKLSLLNFFKKYIVMCYGFLINHNKKIKTFSYTFIDITKHKAATVSYFDFTAGIHHIIKTVLQFKAAAINPAI